MKITSTAFAYIDTRFESVESVRKGQILPRLSLGESDYYQEQGYPCIGTATVTIELHDDKTVTANQLVALGKRLDAVRAENQQRENAILDQISKLQAIGYEVEA